MGASTKYQIVVAEDCKQDLFLIQLALDQEAIPYEMQNFVDGDQVIRHFDAIATDLSLNCPDLVLLDLNMPKRSGEEVFERLRNIPRCEKTPVVVMTSSDSPTDRARARELGAVAFFRKPADLEQFLRIGSLVRDALRWQRRGCDAAV